MKIGGKKKKQKRITPTNCNKIKDHFKSRSIYVLYTFFCWPNIWVWLSRQPTVVNTQGPELTRRRCSTSILSLTFYLMQYLETLLRHLQSWCFLPKNGKSKCINRNKKVKETEAFACRCRTASVSNSKG